MGSKKYVARECVQSSECFVEVLFDSWVGGWLPRCIEEAVLRKRPQTANDGRPPLRTASASASITMSRAWVCLSTSAAPPM